MEQDRLFDLMALAEKQQDAVHSASAQLSIELAAQALGEATRPVLNRLAGVVQAAGATEGQLQRAGQWFAWKWVAVAAGGMAGACLLAWVSVAWQRHQVDQLTEQKAALQSDVVDLQAKVADLEKRGGRIRMGKCGKRLCIEASPNQGTDGSVWTNAWKTANGTPLVIPRGY